MPCPALQPLQTPEPLPSPLPALSAAHSPQKGGSHCGGGGTALTPWSPGACGGGGGGRERRQQWAPPASAPLTPAPRAPEGAGQPAGAVTRWPCDLGQLPWASVPPPSETGTTVVLTLEQREHVFPACRVVHARKCKWTLLTDRLIDAITVVNAGVGPPPPQDRSLSHIPLTSPADPQVGPGPLGAVLLPPGPSPRETSPAPPLLRRWAPSHCLLLTVRVFWLRRAGRAS